VSPKEKKTIIVVQNIPITVIGAGEEDFISLTDIAKSFDGGVALIENWLKNKDTLLFLAAWERMNNPTFNSLEFEGIKAEAGRNSFYISAKKWIDLTNATGLRSSAGRYGGTYAHKDIAFEFGTWLSPEFKLFLIKEFQRLKDDEARRSSLDWNLSRALSKINYRIHTDAIKEHIIPKALSQEEIMFAYPTEADLLNMALFGMTAKFCAELAFRIASGVVRTV
jgi:KilA-N domain